MNTLFDSLHERHLAEPNNSALSVMLNADDPIETTQIYSNIKIAIGGGINEPRDALNTILFGLLTNLDQLRQVKQQDDWERAFEEGVRWVAPIQVSSRLVMEDTEIRGFHIPKGDTVMTIQASANRDEDRYEDGESFQVYRERQSHQAFGQRFAFLSGNACGAPCGGACDAADAVRQVSGHDHPRSGRRYLARFRIPWPDADSGQTAIGCQAG